MKYITLICFAMISFISCTQKNNTLEERKEKINEAESISLTADQTERRNKSIDYCKKHSIPTIEHLPCIESEAEVKIRNQDEVIGRVFALCYLGLKSEGLEKKHLNEFDQKYGASAYFTETEKGYAFTELPTEQQTADANWRYESLHVLLWSLGYIDSLRYPGELCNVAEDVKTIFSRSKEQFIGQAKLRSKKEILDQADLIYRINWACVNARTKNEEPASGLNASVVYERHYALNWLINYMDQAWDDVSTDT